MKVNGANNIGSRFEEIAAKKPILTTINDATIEIIIMPMVAGNFRNLKLI